VCIIHQRKKADAKIVIDVSNELLHQWNAQMQRFEVKDGDINI